MDTIKGKYAPLFDFLRNQTERIVTVKFEEIEKIICNKLPTSAYKHRAWWGNTRSGTYVQSAAWIEANFRVEDVIFGEEVIFQKTSSQLLTKKRYKNTRKKKIPPTKEII
ncbi:hypothetical protein KZO01_02510 [Kurthia zopfii]|uniref:DUF7662 domain-containing protein n=1 Tax=Kurthia zopfii TaxID=1650 RepID=A0A2U3AFN2_9BACL|nr:hypothetical protein [Kurthia zopfii]PWI23261.1 hypothetical protein DF281_03075 [Kurthia zopfii]TDR42118.1 hypothetical protein DFR61_1048 [Kurthia zopfii]STX10963.1 Uncharacterised protein [Kurthia zopfii]VEI05663.1 Uncharacterised protein [Kurthia zopfii]GEK29942.1 hypothetical protein KZO01_02510 [Kurthia zopfii]